MPRSLLIVDDDGPARRSLRRALATRVPTLDIVAACDGVEAVEFMQQRPFDVVLTDIRMPRMDGFELLDWLRHERPDVRAIAMTAFETVGTSSRVSERGGLLCLDKPIDLDALERMLTGQELSVWGHVANIDVTAFLQLVQMERKTCTLHVAGPLAEGWIHMRDGEVRDAKRTDGTTGEAALIALVAAPQSARIAIGPIHLEHQNRISAPLSFLLMEAARLRDEQSRAPRAVAVDATSRLELTPILGSDPSLIDTVDDGGSPELDEAFDEIADHPGLRSMTLFDAQAGVILTQAGRQLPSEAATRDLIDEWVCLTRAYPDASLEEMVTSTANHRIWMKATARPHIAVVLIADAASTSVGLGGRLVKLATATVDRLAPLPP